MRRIGRLPVTLVGLSLVACWIGNSPVNAAEVLVNGGLEDSAGPSGWTLTQSITGEPGSPISVYEHVDQANEPGPLAGELGLLIKPFAGNVGTYMDQNKAVNFSLSQTFSFGPSAAGRTYSFVGHSYFQAASSPIIDNLFADSPSGAIPSPTESSFELAFLNASDAVVGSPITFDLRDDPTTEAWRTHTLMGVAPATTTKIRVTANATDMVASCTTACEAGQDMRLDNFSLTDGVLPTNRLVNGNLNTLGAPAGWSIDKTPEDNLQFSGATYANRPGSGATGMWLRAFAGGDAQIIQTLPATADADYSFSGWAKWEDGYSGYLDPSNVDTFLRMEFLNGSDAVIGSPLTLQLYDDGQTNDAMWMQHTLEGTAPAGTASIRVSAGAAGMFDTLFNPQSAFFDDFSLIETIIGGGLAGDYNGDEVIDGADYTTWRDAVTASLSSLLNDPTPGTVDESDFVYWRDHYGETLGSGAGSGAAAVPEPGSVLLLTLGMGLAMASIRRCRS